MFLEQVFYVVFCIALSVVYHLNVSFSRLITSVGEERAVFFCYRLLYLCCFCSKEFLFPSPWNKYPLTPHFYIVKLGFTGVYIFSYFLLQNIDCGYSFEPPHCKNKKNIKTIHLKINIFTALEYFSILHGRVFVMLWVLGKCCIILFRHSLCLPYKYGNTQCYTSCRYCLFLISAKR